MSVKHAPANAWTVPFGALALLTVLLVAALVGAALGFTHGGRPVSPALTRHPVTRTALLAMKKAQTEAREGAVVVRLPAPVTRADLLALKEGRMEAATQAVRRALPQPVTAADLMALKDARANER
jgi:hypothetical protein